MAGKPKDPFGGFKKAGYKSRDEFIARTAHWTDQSEKELRNNPYDKWAAKQANLSFDAWVQKGAEQAEKDFEERVKEQRKSK